MGIEGLIIEKKIILIGGVCHLLIKDLVALTFLSQLTGGFELSEGLGVVDKRFDGCSNDAVGRQGKPMHEVPNPLVADR